MDLTIIIPTYNEKSSIAKLVNEIEGTIGQGLEYEILFVDDSTDDTPQVLYKLGLQNPRVRYIHRDGCRGLASAVKEGFKHACGENIIVMDADLQHPPGLIPLMLERLRTAEIVIPSRFITGGSDGGLKLPRKLVSWTARMVARLSIKRLRYISDCTSGYFGLQRKVVDGVNMEPVGWKILMEVLVRGNYSTVHEVPYTFAARSIGESKMGFREQWQYLLHVARLVRSSPDDLKFYLFCVIGLSGVLVNMLALAAFVGIFQTEGMLASVAASVVAMLHNFVLNDRITWKSRKKVTFWRRSAQLSQFMFICSLGISSTALIVSGFISLGWNIYAGQLVGILIATCWNFSANNLWTWPVDRADAELHKKLIVIQEYSREIY